MLLSRVLQFKNRYTQYSEMTCIHIFILWMAMSSYISALFHAVLCCIAGNLCPGHHGSQYGAPSLNVNINVSIYQCQNWGAPVLWQVSECISRDKTGHFTARAEDQSKYQTH